jgi:hypothetical protein
MTDVCITEIKALEHMYRTSPEGQLQRKGYHRKRKSWQTLRILVMMVFSFYGVMKRWKL